MHKDDHRKSAGALRDGERSSKSRGTCRGGVSGQKLLIGKRERLDRVRFDPDRQVLRRELLRVSCGEQQ